MCMRPSSPGVLHRAPTSPSLHLPISSHSSQPVTSDFLDISNPKAVLERTLRSYTCLTVGDVFVVHYNNKNYEIEVGAYEGRGVRGSALRRPPGAIPHTHNTTQHTWACASCFSSGESSHITHHSTPLHTTHCLTHCITLPHTQVREAAPAPAVSVVETDCRVEFEAPKDYKVNRGWAVE